ncbi:MAG: GNAT family N-acetyltransferase [Bacteroidetes bacterium]|nr:GNAT family N-acetyltransferase [Bacteroidota bacterium]
MRLVAPLESDNYLLREIVPEDEEGLWLLDSDPEVHRYLGNEPVTHIERIREVIALIRKQYQDYGIGRWAVVHKASGTFVGWCGLKFIVNAEEGQPGTYDLGYRLRREWWGKGIATECGKLCLDYGLNQLQLEQIFARAHTDNAGSNRVLQKLGFTRTGTGISHGEPTHFYRYSAKTNNNNPDHFEPEIKV